MDKNHTLKALSYLIAAICVAVLAAGMMLIVCKLTLPENFAQYEVLLPVCAFLSLGFYLLTSVPCAVMTAIHSICAMVRDRKFLFPAVFLLADGALIFLWIYVIYQLKHIAI